MTTEQLEKAICELEELEKVTTQSPWVFVSRENLDDKESDVILLNGFWGAGHRPLFRVVPGWGARQRDEKEKVEWSVDAKNGEFIALARNLLPHLIKAWREMKKVLTDRPWVLNQLSQKDAVIEKMMDSLNKIASWGEREIVTGAFSEPASAMEARHCLAEINSTEKKEGE